MNRPTSTTGSSVRAVGLLLLAGLILVALPASAQVIKVTSAVPDMADQGTLGIVVTIGGENFPANSKVAFYVTNTKNPGGIAVKGVKFKDSKTLEATIDVAPDAQTDLKFDIQVMSGSRTGKGTELFKVLVKTTGADLTPPGVVYDLGVVGTTTNSAVLTWTEPADDNFDLKSGPAASYDIRVRKATTGCGPVPVAAWADDAATWKRSDPCAVTQVSGTPGAPLGTASANVSSLAANSQYWVALRTADDSPQGPNWSDPSEPQLLFSTASFPLSPWTSQVVDACSPADTSCRMGGMPRLGFDKDTHNPVMLYVKSYVATLARWTGSSWAIESLPVTIDTGNYMYDFAVDPITGELTIASIVRGSRDNEVKFYRRIGAIWQADSLATGSVGRASLGFDPVFDIPTVAYQSTTKSGSSSVRVAQKHGAVWTTETVAAGSGTLSRPVAFDASGNPSVAFAQLVGGVPRLAFGLRTGGSWTIEWPDAQAPGTLWASSLDQVVAVAFDPSRSLFYAAAIYPSASREADQIRFCQRTAPGSWSCQLVAEGSHLSNLCLDVDGLGTAYLAYREYGAQIDLRMLVRRPGGTDWAAESVDWNVSISLAGDLAIGPDQAPAMVYGSANDSSGAANYSMSFARRNPPAQ